MRSGGHNWYNKWLLDIGDGNTPSISGAPSDSVEFLEEIVIKNDIIESVYGSNIHNMSVSELSKRAILAPTNKDALEINKKIIEKIPGETKVYNSSDTLIPHDTTDASNYPPEILYELTPSGMPPHILELKVGSIVILLRNLNPKKGLCNGTRLIIEALGENIIHARILSECNNNDSVFIPRIDLRPSDTILPFDFKRRQFPIILAYTMTINKSQGQSFDYVGVMLSETVFAHGQLYVALSRSRNPNQMKVFILDNPIQGDILKDGRTFTSNIVYKEVF